jgi:Uma2 family endonuclease
MSSFSRARATLDDLAREEGKAELIAGKVVRFEPSGHFPSVAADEVFASLRQHVRLTGYGVAFGGGIGYAVPELPSGRESFSPDASYYDGPRPANRMRFIDGAPTFAVEVRSEHDYGDSAEAEMAAKRADYFAAGTRAVWDVDPQAGTVTLSRADAPEAPITLRRGDVADAGPAVPGWRMAVNDGFAE